MRRVLPSWIWKGIPEVEGSERVGSIFYGIVGSGKGILGEDEFRGFKCRSERVCFRGCCAASDGGKRLREVGESWPL